MLLQKRKPHDGNERIVSKFAWWPTRIDHYSMVWLCRYWMAQKYVVSTHFGDVIRKWETMMWHDEGREEHHPVRIPHVRVVNGKVFKGKPTWLIFERQREHLNLSFEESYGCYRHQSIVRQVVNNIRKLVRLS